MRRRGPRRSRADGLQGRPVAMCSLCSIPSHASEVGSPTYLSEYNAIAAGGASAERPDEARPRGNRERGRPRDAAHMTSVISAVMKIDQTWLCDPGTIMYGSTQYRSGTAHARENVGRNSPRITKSSTR